LVHHQYKPSVARNSVTNVIQTKDICHPLREKCKKVLLDGLIDKLK